MATGNADSESDSASGVALALAVSDSESLTGRLTRSASGQDSADSPGRSLSPSSLALAECSGSDRDSES